MWGGDWLKDLEGLGELGEEELEIEPASRALAESSNSGAGMDGVPMTVLQPRVPAESPNENPDVGPRDEESEEEEPFGMRTRRKGK